MWCSRESRPAVTGIRRDGGLARRALLVAVTGAALAAAGCGFKLRGLQSYPFDTISVPGTTPLGVELRRGLAASSGRTQVVANPADADAVLTILGEQQEKVVLSLNTQGKVREYQLRYRVTYRVSGQKGVEYILPTAILLTRDITFNDQILAKEVEETQLYREMRSDVVQQIIRRLALAKPIQPEQE